MVTTSVTTHVPGAYRSMARTCRALASRDRAAKSMVIIPLGSHEYRMHHSPNAVGCATSSLARQAAVKERIGEPLRARDRQRHIRAVLPRDVEDVRIRSDRIDLLLPSSVLPDQ